MDVSCSLKMFKFQKGLYKGLYRVIWGVIYGSIIGLVKGDTRSLD